MPTETHIVAQPGLAEAFTLSTIEENSPITIVELVSALAQ